MAPSNMVDLPFAPLAVLAFLGACMAVVACFAAITYCSLTGRLRQAKIWLLVMGSGLGAYAALLLGVSLFSKEYVLGAGVEKYFCEIDCHLAYSVQNVQQAKNISGQTAHGNFYVVTLRTRFDERTISARRPKDAPLTPNPRNIVVLDADGQAYAPVMEPRDAGTRPMTTPLIPGESYLTRLVFDLPANVREPRLYVDNAPWPNRVLIGHEDSPLHGKIYFRLAVTG